MLIDWFTVIAQVVNFLVLVWLMKRFLYKPILSAIDAREKGIAVRLAEANAKTAETQRIRDDFQHKNETFDQQCTALMSKAMDDAKAERQRLLDEARKDADAVRSSWQDALHNEQHALGEEIIRRTQQGVFDISRKTLAELATTDLEASMSALFIVRLRSLRATEHEQFATALKTSSHPVQVRSAFDLPPAQRAAIQNALDDVFSAEIPLRFETAPNLVSGIELTTNGQKLAWSISDFLASLQKDVGELVEEKTKPEAKPNTEVSRDPTPQLVSR